MKTLSVAEHMLSTGQFYSASLLAKELGISAVEASGKLFNSRTSHKYSCIITPMPRRKVKVQAINGRKFTNSALWNLALFGKPLPKAAA